MATFTIKAYDRTETFEVTEKAYWEKWLFGAGAVLEEDLDPDGDVATLDSTLPWKEIVRIIEHERWSLF